MSEDKSNRRAGSFNRREVPRGEIALGKIALLGGVFVVCVLAAIFLFWR
jgi:hypothetical protein